MLGLHAPPLFGRLARALTENVFVYFLVFRIGFTGKDNDSSSEFPKGGGGVSTPPNPPKKGTAVSAVVPPVTLGLGLSMGRRSLLLSGTSGVPEGGVSLLDRRGDCKTGPPALELQVDLSEYHLVVALAEFTGVLEGALLTFCDFSQITWRALFRSGVTSFLYILNRATRRR
jgi:hypothetical protein